MTATGVAAAGGRRHVSALLELAALTGFAVAQPVFGVLAGSTDYLVFSGAGRAQIVALAVVLAVVPPLVLWLVDLAGGRLFPSLAAPLHGLLVGGLLAVVVLQALRRATPLGPLAALAGAAAAGALLAVVHARWRPARLWTRVASPAPLVFAALFLFASPVSGLLGGAPSTVAAAVDGEAPAPVVLVVFDEFPLLTTLTDGGDIDERLFPNLAALAREATFFRNTTSVAARTTHAVPSILTGRLPRDVAPTTSQYPDNLFTLLGASHDVRAFESVTSLCPRSVCPRDASRYGRWRLFDDALRIWIGTVSRGAGGDALGAWYGEEPGGESVRFERFLASIDGEGTPFHFVHVILPHAPWEFLPDGLRYPPRDLGLLAYDQRTGEAWPALVDHHRHVLQAMYVDSLIGRTVERLRQVGLYERATLLVTADHGVSFEPGLSEGTRTLVPETAHEIAWVPFLLKAPGQTEGTVSDDNVMTIDVTPTVAELAGRPPPWPVDGIPLRGAPPRDPEKLWFNVPGTAVDIDEQEAYRRVLSGVVHGLAGPDGGAEGIFEIGPFAHLIGTAADGYEPGDEPGAVAVVDDLGSYDAVDVGSGIVPALVSGRLDLPPDTTPPAAVAIVLNGTVAAVSALYVEGDQPHRFATLVSPRWMQPGANTFEVLLLFDGGGRHVDLRRVEVAGT